jgi:hypothetical protein
VSSLAAVSFFESVQPAKWRASTLHTPRQFSSVEFADLVDGGQIRLFDEIHLSFAVADSGPAQSWKKGRRSHHVLVNPKDFRE